MHAAKIHNCCFKNNSMFLSLQVGELDLFNKLWHNSNKMMRE